MRLRRQMELNEKLSMMPTRKGSWGWAAVLRIRKTNKHLPLHRASLAGHRNSRCGIRVGSRALHQRCGGCNGPPRQTANVELESSKRASYLLLISQYMQSIPKVGVIQTSYIEAHWTPDGDTLDSHGCLEKHNRVCRTSPIER